MLLAVTLAALCTSLVGKAQTAANTAQSSRPPTQAVSQASSTPITPRPPLGPLGETHEPLLGGTHWRLVTKNGVVHVWEPPRYRTGTAGIVIYLHGYWCTNDTAWSEQRLVEQFAQSERNALFIAAESPAGDSEGVFWPNLGELLKTVERSTRQRLPTGPVVTVAHSGAFRTVARWIDFPRLDEIILLDGLYNQLDQFGAWLTKVPGHQRNRLILVSCDTTDRAAGFIGKFNHALVMPALPKQAVDFTLAHRRAPLLHVHSQYEHMDLVLNGKVIPLLLKISPHLHE